MDQSLASVMRNINDALRLDDDSHDKEAYMKYLDCVLCITCNLQQSVSSMGGDVVITKQVSKQVKLAQQCVDRLAVLVDKIGSGQKPAVLTSPQEDSIAARVKGRAFMVVPPLPSQPASNTFARTKVRGPMELAYKQNHQLMTAYKARLQRMNKGDPGAFNLSLTIQRKMAENLAIAKRMEMALAKKMQERQDRLEEQAAKRFATPVGMSQEEQEQRHIYKQILDYEQDAKWLQEWRGKLQSVPEEPELICQLIQEILRCRDHPLTVLLRQYQYKVYEKIYPLVCNKKQRLEAVIVPLDRQLWPLELYDTAENQHNVCDQHEGDGGTQHDQHSLSGQHEGDESRWHDQHSVCGPHGGAGDEDQHRELDVGRKQDSIDSDPDCLPSGQQPVNDHDCLPAGQQSEQDGCPAQDTQHEEEKEGVDSVCDNTHHTADDTQHPFDDTHNTADDTHFDACHTVDEIRHNPHHTADTHHTADETRHSDDGCDESRTKLCEEGGDNTTANLDKQVHGENRTKLCEEGSDETDVPASDSISQFAADTKDSLSTAIQQGEHLQTQLRTEQKKSSRILRQISNDYEKYNAENMDDLFDDDDEEGEELVISLSKTPSVDQESHQPSESHNTTESSPPSLLSTSSQSSEERLDSLSYRSGREDRADSCRSSSGSSAQDFPSLPSVEKDKSEIERMSAEAYHRHLKNISADVHMYMEKLLILFTIAYEQLDSPLGRDQCYASLEETFFKPLWKFLLMLFRLAHYKEELSVACKMTQNYEVSPRDMGVTDKLCLLPSTGGQSSGDPSDTHPYQQAIRHLTCIQNHYTMLGKLECVVKVVHLIFDCIKEFYIQQGFDPSDVPSVGADDLLPVMSYVVMKTHLPQLVSECQAMAQFIHEGYIMGQEGYCLTTLETAVSFIVTSNLQQPVTPDL